MCVSCNAFLFGLCGDPFSPSSLQLGRTRCTCLLSDKSDGTEYRCQPEGCRFVDGGGSFLSLYCTRRGEQSTCTRLGSAASRPNPLLYDQKRVLRISEKSSNSLKLPSKLGVQIHEMVRRRDLPSDWTTNPPIALAAITDVGEPPSGAGIDQQWGYCSGLGHRSSIIRL